MLSPALRASKLSTFSSVFLEVPLRFIKAISTVSRLYTVSVRQTRFRRKSPIIAKQFRDLWAFSPVFHGPPFAEWRDMTNSEVFPIVHGGLVAPKKSEP